MKKPSSATETVFRHLQAFVEQQGIEAILSDYADDACFISERRTYRGKSEIREFFEDFITTMPPQSIEQFSLRSLRFDGDVAHVIWGAGSELPFGTDTFVVQDGKIVSQTFAMYVPAAA